MKLNDNGYNRFNVNTAFKLLSPRSHFDSRTNYIHLCLFYFFKFFLPSLMPVINDRLGPFL